MEYSFKKNRNKPIYSNSLPFQKCINYLSKREVGQISHDELFNSFKYILSCSQYEKRQFHMDYDSVIGLSLRKHQNTYNHINSTNHYYNEEKFWNTEILIRINSCLTENQATIDEPKKFNYNDDNFNHLASSSLTNYSTNYASDKLRNSNFFNTERAKNMLWRQMFIKKSGKYGKNLFASIKENPNDGLKDLYSIMESHFSLKKFSAHKDEKLSYLAITVPDQHLIFNAPLINDHRLSNININNNIEYKHFSFDEFFTTQNQEQVLDENIGEKFMMIGPPSQYQEHDDDEDSAVGSFESVFSFMEKDSRSSSLSTTSKFEDNEDLQPKTPDDQEILQNNELIGVSKDIFFQDDLKALICGGGITSSPLKSCLKNTCNYSTLADAKELMMNYYHDINPGKLKKKKTVMFSTEISCARIVEYLDEEEREARLLKCKNLETTYIMNIQELNSNFDAISNYYYNGGNSMCSEEERLSLKMDYTSFNNSINKECELLKMKYKKNKLKMIRLKNGKHIVKLKKKYLKDGHFVENLSNLKREKLTTNPEFKNHFSVRYNKFILLRNIVTQDDLDYLFELQNSGLCSTTY